MATANAMTLTLADGSSVVAHRRATPVLRRTEGVGAVPCYFGETAE
jgi:hypothetical protein